MYETVKNKWTTIGIVSWGDILNKILKSKLNRNIKSIVLESRDAVMRWKIS